MQKSFGKKHNYIGMEVEFLDDRFVSLKVLDHIQETIDDFEEDLGRVANNPTNKQIFVAVGPTIIIVRVGAFGLGFARSWAIATIFVSVRKCGS